MMIFTRAGTLLAPNIGAAPTKAAILIKGQKYCATHKVISAVVNFTLNRHLLLPNQVWYILEQPLRIYDHGP